MQYTEANSLTKGLKRLDAGRRRERNDVEATAQACVSAKERPKSSKLLVDLLPSWNLSHSYLAVMGGFVVEDATGDERMFPRGYERLTVTPQGLSWLLERYPDLKIDSSITAIRCRCNADGFGKTLVLLQGWSK